MSTSTSAKLMYGYHLKNDEDGWLIQPVDGKDEDDWDAIISDAGEDRLRESVGFDGTGYDDDPEDWRTRRRAADAKVGVVLEHGGYDFSDLYLSAKTYEVYFSAECMTIDPAVLLAEAGEDADARLRHALQALGVAPVQEKPAWLLTGLRA